MAKSPEELLAVRVGAATVGENLRHAIETGEAFEDENGFLSSAERPPNVNWAVVPNGPPLGCSFLIHFLFPAAYARSAVPHGCQACYKVKVTLKTVRELVAAWGIGKRIECLSKWGADLDTRYSQDVYAGYFYTSGLEAARAIYWIAREAIDNDPKLGPNVRMTIKRGCSEYEAKLGPSDKYEFSPELAEVEAYLKTRFRERKRNRDQLRPVPLLHWIDVAFRVGDDTYLDFTDGQRLHRKMVGYDPGASKRG